MGFAFESEFDSAAGMLCRHLSMRERMFKDAGACVIWSVADVAFGGYGLWSLETCGSHQLVQSTLTPTARVRLRVQSFSAGTNIRKHHLNALIAHPTQQGDEALVRAGKQVRRLRMHVPPRSTCHNLPPQDPKIQTHPRVRGDD